MAIFHLSVKPVSRSQGRSATAAAAYRSGSRIVCAREDRVHDYTRKGGVDRDSCTITVPNGAAWATDREALWNAAEAAETRKNATVAREYELALPAELSAAERVALARKFGQLISNRYGVAADIAIHAPHRNGDQRNFHAHVLTTTRAVEKNGCLGAKTRILDERKTGPQEIVVIRSLWEQLANAALAAVGEAVRIDHRSLAAQGIERTPTIHVGPKSAAMAERGVRPESRNRDGKKGRKIRWPEIDEGKTRSERNAQIHAENAEVRARPDEAAPASPPWTEDYGCDPGSAPGHAGDAPRRDRDQGGYSGDLESSGADRGRDRPGDGGPGPDREADYVEIRGVESSADPDRAAARHARIKATLARARAAVRQTEQRTRERL
jgi:hypothetical protein